MKPKIIQLIAAILIALAVFGGVAAATTPVATAQEIESVFRAPVHKLRKSPVMLAWRK
jgi:hypothetical protein